jgi:two-component system NtrC family response regulator
MPERAGHAPDNADASGAMILVIDDELGIRRVIERQLNRLGYRPLLAGNGEDGLRLFDENAPDIQLVLLDWNMPGRSGKETLAALLQRRSDLRVILVTGSTEATTDEHATHDTVSILQKPFTPAQLTLVVRAVLGA